MVPVKEVPLAVDEFKGLVVWVAVSSFICFVANKNVAASFFWGVCLPPGSSFDVSRKFVFWVDANEVFSGEDIPLSSEFEGILKAIQGREASTYVKAAAGLRFQVYSIESSRLKHH